MNVLIGCECSGTIRRAFRAKGHNAWSCDLIPAGDGDKHHITGDVLEVLKTSDTKWDLFICHPVCKRLANSGVLRLYRGGKKTGGLDPLKWQELIEAATFFTEIWLRAKHIPKVCLENPVQHCHAKKLLALYGVPEFTQSIQPFQFGNPESKRTCLWLRGLPELKPTNILPLPACGHWENQTPSGQNKLGPSEKRAAVRAVTYSGIAAAMAEQWG